MKKMMSTLFAILIMGSVTLKSLYAVEGVKSGEKPGEDIESLLDTLNEVLDENRKIKKEIQANEEILQKLQTENMQLKGQIRTLQKTQDRSRSDRAEVERLQGQINEIERANLNLAASKRRLQDNVSSLEAETERMKSLLNTSILESERIQYLELVENAQVVADRSLKELKTSKSQNEHLKTDVAEAHYRLGNLLFDMKDFKGAIAAYTKVLELNPSDVWIHHNLGIIYDYYIHNDLLALFHYRNYLQLTKDQTDSNEIRSRVLELELKKNLKPGQPLKEDFEGMYTKSPR